MGNLIGKLASGELVYDREDNSHIHNGVSLELIKMTIQEESSNGRGVFWISKHFEKSIGTNACIKTTKDDDKDIFYAIRKGRFGYSRLIKNHKAPECNQLTLLLEKSKTGDFFTLLTAFVGPLAEPEPTDITMKFSEESLEKAIDFWKCHALIPDNEAYDTETITIKIPEYINNILMQNSVIASKTKQSRIN